jgi:hypothetical protein
LISTSRTIKQTEVVYLVCPLDLAASHGSHGLKLLAPVERLATRLRLAPCSQQGLVVVGSQLKGFDASSLCLQRLIPLPLFRSAGLLA